MGNQFLLQLPDRDLRGTYIFCDRHFCCSSGGFTHGHARRHHPDGRHRLMGGGNCPSSHEKVLHIFRHKGAIRNIIAVATPGKGTPSVFGVVQVQRITGYGNGIVKSPTSQNILFGHGELSLDSSSFPDS